MMLRTFVIVFASALAAGLIVGAVARAHRRRIAPTELNEHPERLDQMLDPTDDA
jgi:hypothetical protein